MNSLVSKDNLKQFDRQIYQTWGMLPEMNEYDENITEVLVEKIQIAFAKGFPFQDSIKIESDYQNKFRDYRETYNKERNMGSGQYGGQMDSDKIRSKASHMMSEDIIEPAQQYIKKAREYGSNALDRGTEIVRENPGYTILGAAAVGFLFGAYVARRR
ncbi:MAG: hypothetical protein EHM20_10635 [Alphaproteobacteria bacterium]|nr:MAG: hypothetical protein EHM20_10635 [Alphaproteobacteria bacterium]